MSLFLFVIVLDGACRKVAGLESIEAFRARASQVKAMRHKTIRGILSLNHETHNFRVTLLGSLECSRHPDEEVAQNLRPIAHPWKPSDAHGLFGVHR